MAVNDRGLDSAQLIARWKIPDPNRGLLNPAYPGAGQVMRRTLGHRGVVHIGALVVQHVRLSHPCHVVCGLWYGMLRLRTQAPL